MTQPHPIQRVVSRMLEDQPEQEHEPKAPPETVEDVLRDVAEVLAEQKAQHDAWMKCAEKADEARAMKQKAEYQIEVLAARVIRGEAKESELDAPVLQKAKAEAILAGERLANHEARMAEQSLRPKLLEVQERLATVLDREAATKGLELLADFMAWRSELVKPLDKFGEVRASNGAQFIDYVVGQTRILKAIERVLQGLGEV